MYSSRATSIKACKYGLSLLLYMEGGRASGSAPEGSHSHGEHVPDVKDGLIAGFRP